jgi:hypothetical protein
VPSGSHIQQWQSQALTREALHRILACAPPKDDLDLETLLEDLEFARTHYLNGKKFRKSRTQEQQKLARLEKAVRKVDLLLADEQVWKDIRWHQRYTEQDPRQLVALLRTAIERRLSYRSPTEPAWGPQIAREYLHELGVEERSAAEWLAGQHLPLLYEKHFGLEATLSRDTDGKPTGPYIEFAKQVLIEFGIDYSVGAIAKALSDVRNGRVRRKK